MDVPCESGTRPKDDFESAASAGYGLLHRAHRLPVAGDAQRLSELAWCLLPLSQMGQRWHSAPHQRGSMQEPERRKRGRKSQPTGTAIDSQSVKTTALAQERGFDGHKRVKGHKRRILTDTMGILLNVVVHTADIADCKGAPSLIKKVAETLHHHHWTIEVW
jgi:hypothetical protein